MSLELGDYGEAGKRHCRINCVVLWFSISFITLLGVVGLGSWFGGEYFERERLCRL